MLDPVQRVISLWSPSPRTPSVARTLMHLGRVGTLSTHSRKQPGFPFGSVMPYGLDDHGRPIFFISTMAMHTQNLQADARASLLVTPTYKGDRGFERYVGWCVITKNLFSIARYQQRRRDHDQVG